MIINFYTITALINFIVCGLMAVFIILKGRKDQMKISFFILNSSTALWNLFYFFWQNSMDSATSALFFARALMVPVTIIPAAYAHFAAAVTETIKKEKKILVTFYIISIIFFLSSLTPYFIDRVEPIMEFKYWPMANYLNTAFWACFFVFSVYASYLVLKGYFTAKGTKKLQLRYVSIGVIISIASGTFDIWPWYGIPIPPVAHVLVPVYILMIGYAITRYRLMNIKLVARNIFFYFIFASVLYGVFYATAFIYQWLFGGIFTTWAYLLGFIIAPVLAIIMYGGSEYLSKLINKYLFPSIYEYQRTVTRVSHELSHYTSLEKITSIITDTLNEVIKPRNVIIFLAQDKKNTVSLDYEVFENYFKSAPNVVVKEELEQIINEKEGRENIDGLIKLKSQLDRNSIYVCLALKNKDDFSGVIALEEKRDGDSYDQEDIKLLEILSYQAGIAVNNAILYKKIEEKNKYLQELLDVKNDFIRIANHQLNTPLSIMRNAYSLVEDKTMTMKEGMKYWKEGISRMSSTIADFWKVLESEGEIKTNPSPVDIMSLAEKLVDERKKLLPKLNKKIKILIEKNNGIKSDLKVFCDPNQINYAFSNLLDNAIAYTKEGSVTVSYNLTENGKYLEMNVKDTGIGLSQEDAKKIGQKFFRSKEGILAKPDGSGLGIYICKKFIEGNKGLFSFQSPGKNMGSTFTFALPVKS